MPPTRRLAAVAAQDSASPCRRLLTTQEAAAVAQVTPACIRQWTSRGYLVPAARQGRANLYLEDHVLRAERIRRNRRPAARSTPQPDQIVARLVSGRRRGPQHAAREPRQQAQLSPALFMARQQAAHTPQRLLRGAPPLSSTWRWIRVPRWTWRPARPQCRETHRHHEDRD
ncbi:helix-turn-helix domain-containing protein [Streptomyces sp. ET3-23]|uniref:MerR family transcriptional regulator n=1 Tax=Streptomyces sp. ET3-23 TaxID=2885643 RepID=UPI001D1044B2|nr:MerR family transcriptional regulator [Streptomyces sp. ET3-23]MCC2280938.1 helix-turn-helix domain-containing protein [Streptomyces sp. ET3-23]